MVSNELEQDLKEAVNTVPIPKHDLQQLLSWIREIEEIAQFIDDEVFKEPYGSLEYSAKITKKNFRKMRKLITAALRRDKNFSGGLPGVRPNCRNVITRQL